MQEYFALFKSSLDVTQNKQFLSNLRGLFVGKKYALLLKCLL